MYANDSISRLIRLTDTSLTVSDPAADLRGRQVLDSDGHEIGKVEDLLIDEEEKKVRFLRIGSGGFLGLGKEHFLLPVEAVASVESDALTISRDRARLSEAPEYDPSLAYDDTYYSDVYGWWGYGPYWSPGSIYPPYPYYR